jgi:hypothetical protein
MIGQIVRNVLEDIHTVTLSMRETEQEAASGTQLTQQVGKALETIFSVVEHQAGEIEVTNQTAKQHLESSATVVQIMQHVSESAQQISDSTREATQQMERLAELAGQLLTSVEVFKLREDYKQPASAPGARPTSVQGKQADNNLLGQKPGPVRLLKSAGENPFSGLFGRQSQ